ncbi:3-oxoacyl-[acyl-carrier-protein] reductase FabG-like [Anticarsia gemmatalis]|uniref:3-oxoacyl-[acyl-carrier-protein] reductase FabG-like n=1 Tax=Anticarsia gemmatalis TaxID=129554 RepID=UPI003F75FD5C
MSFNSKVVLITGASSGIGAACAIRFAKSSATLALVGRNHDNLTKIALQCEKLNHLKPLLIIADITSENDIERIVEETIKKYSKIDVLINNAGVNSVPGAHTPAEAYDRVMTTNLRGTYLLSTKVIPYLTKTKGNIVNISSILSNKPIPVMTPYCMSKAALDMFTKCTALQLGPKGVRVNSVNPGPVKTELFRRGGMSDTDCDTMFTGIEMKSPLKKITTGEDVAELVLFLASDRASCINGSCYVIDCGLMLGDAGGL